MDGDLDAVAAALDTIPIDFPDGGFRPLGLAITRGRTDVALWLLQRGASPTLCNAGNLTPLHRAAQRGQTDVVAALLEAGAEVDAREWDEARTPLHFATLGSHAEVVAGLLDAGADPAILTVTGMTAIAAAERMASVRSEGPKAARALETLALVRAGARALRGAVALGDLDAVHRELRAGADPNQADSWNITPLITAAALGHEDIVLALLEAGANPGVVAWRRLPFERQRLGAAAEWARSQGFSELAERLG